MKKKRHSPTAVANLQLWMLYLLSQEPTLSAEDRNKLAEEALRVVKATP